MTLHISLDESDAWHRRFAGECNNSAWDLSSLSSRTGDQNQEMLYCAYAAAYHWSQVGTPLHGARADVTLAHVHAQLGHGELALHHARRALAFCLTHPCEDWDVAFAHAELAHAAAVVGDPALHAEHYALAQTTGAAISEEEERVVFMTELARIPAPQP